MLDSNPAQVLHRLLCFDSGLITSNRSCISTPFPRVSPPHCRHLHHHHHHHLNYYVLHKFGFLSASDTLLPETPEPLLYPPPPPLLPYTSRLPPSSPTPCRTKETSEAPPAGPERAPEAAAPPTRTFRPPPNAAPRQSHPPATSPPQALPRPLILASSTSGSASQSEMRYVSCYIPARNGTGRRADGCRRSAARSRATSARRSTRRAVRARRARSPLAV